MPYQSQRLPLSTLSPLDSQHIFTPLTFLIYPCFFPPRFSSHFSPSLPLPFLLRPSQFSVTLSFLHPRRADTSESRHRKRGFRFELPTHKAKPEANKTTSPRMEGKHPAFRFPASGALLSRLLVPSSLIGHFLPHVTRSSQT